MYKKFFSDSLVYIINKVLIRGVSLFLVPIYTRILEPKSYGILDFVTVIGNLITIVIFFEISQALGRQFFEEKDISRKNEYYSTAINLTLGSSFLFIIINLLFINELSLVVTGEEGNELIWLVAVINICAHGIYSLTNGQLRWEGKSKQFSVNTLIYAVTSIILSLVLVVFLRIGVIGIFIAQLMASFVGVYLANKKLSTRYFFIFDVQKLETMLAFSWPLIFSSISISLSYVIDRIIIRALLGVEQLGVYVIGYRVAAIILLISAGFQMAITPIVYKNYENHDSKVFIKDAFRYYLVICFSVLIIISFVSKEIVQILTPEPYHQSWIVIFYLMLSIIIARSIYFFPGMGLMKKTSTIAKIHLLSLPFSILMSVMLIEKFNMLGAALASLMTQLGILFFYVRFNEKLYTLKTRWMNYFIVTVVVLSVYNYLFYYKADEFFIKLILAVFCLMIVLYFLIDRNDVGHVRRFLKEIKAGK